MTNKALAARVDVLSVALQEVVRALEPAQAAQVSEALRERIGVLAGPPLSSDVDEAVSVELVPLLRALHGPGR